MGEISGLLPWFQNHLENLVRPRLLGVSPRVSAEFANLTSFQIKLMLPTVGGAGNYEKLNQVNGSENKHWGQNMATAKYRAEGERGVYNDAQVFELGGGQRGRAGLGKVCLISFGAL